jgi:hypothetical protein
VCIPSTSDLTLAGIHYACSSLALDQVQASNLRLNPLRELSAEIAAELSLRRYLGQEHISYNALKAEPFTHPERSEIILGGRPCHVINTSIVRRWDLRRIEASLAALLIMPACAPESALLSEKWGYQDLLIFTFTLNSPKLAGSNLDYLIYIFTEAWRNAKIGGKTPGFTLQNASDNEIAIVLGGRATHRAHVTQTVRLPPRQPVIVAEDFTNLVYLSTRQSFVATISAHHPTLNRTLRISSDRWGSLWVDGVEIFLAGYIEAGEFRRYARRFASQYLSLPVHDLLPLPQLITWLRALQKNS